MGANEALARIVGGRKLPKEATGSTRRALANPRPTNSWCCNEVFHLLILTRCASPQFRTRRIAAAPIRGGLPQSFGRAGPGTCFDLEEPRRLLSAYRTNAGDRLWVITEADRSSTCILLPEEY